MSSREIILILTYFSVVNSAVFNRYMPGSSFGSNPHRVYIDKAPYKKVNLLASYGLTTTMYNVAEKAVRDHYSGIIMNSGNECNEIAMEMEDRYGGFWMVSIFDADYDIAYTISRRSRSYGVFGIDDKMVLIARDGGKGRHFGPVRRRL